PAKPTVPAATTGFTGFGTVQKASVAPTTTAAPSTTGFTGFGTQQKTAVAPAPSSSNGFTGFGTTSAPAKPTVPAATTGFTGFGTVQKTSEAPATTAAPSTTGFTGFGTQQKTAVAPAPSSSNGFTVFGTTGTTPTAVDQVQMDFGTLHVSGPPHLMKAVAESQRRMGGEKAIEEEVVEPAAVAEQQLQQERPQPAPRRRVRFEDDAQAPVKVEAVDVKREPEVEKELSEGEVEDETDDDAPPEPRFPWGKRPNFRELLAGGKKLALANPSKPVSDYFVGHVHRSYGCTYDHPRNMFYATSPGDRARANGQVVALHGNCKGDPILVATGLVEPAAIAVYEPGLSVCVVTNKGIIVLTEQKDAAGQPAGTFMSRQISHKAYHRGICATAGGGIISWSNGRIRMFDGNVANGDERVLAEANYDMAVNNALFATLPTRRNEKSNCCFMDVVGDRLVMSDLQKHVISLWKVVDARGDSPSEITFVRAIDVALNKEGGGRTTHVRAPQIPLGKCAFAAGIRLDANGWVMCADAEGRTLQIYDDQLQFVSRVETAPNQLPYVSGLYIEARGHIMVCDRKSEMGGLRVFLLESTDDEDDKKPATAAAAAAPGFAAAARLQQQGGRRF
ncbi:hypothetical protein PRIPAC_81818, partial [Pristionchus pacificus]